MADQPRPSDTQRRVLAGLTGAGAFLEVMDATGVGTVRGVPIEPYPIAPVTVQVMIAKGWLESAGTTAEGVKRRAKFYRITAAGRTALRFARVGNR